MSLLVVFSVIQSDWSLRQGIHAVIFDIASNSDVFSTSLSASGLGIGCIANDHLAVNEDERLIHKLEGFQTKSIVALGGGVDYHCVVNGAAGEQMKKSYLGITRIS